MPMRPSDEIGSDTPTTPDRSVVKVSKSPQVEASMFDGLALIQSLSLTESRSNIPKVPDRPIVRVLKYVGAGALMFGGIALVETGMAHDDVRLEKRMELQVQKDLQSFGSYGALPAKMAYTIVSMVDATCKEVDKECLSTLPRDATGHRMASAATLNTALKSALDHSSKSPGGKISQLDALSRNLNNLYETQYPKGPH